MLTLFLNHAVLAMAVLIVVLCQATIALATTTSSSLLLENAVLPSGFDAYELPVAVNRVRMVIAIGTSSAVAVEVATNRIVVLWDSDGDDVADTKTTLVNCTANCGRGLSHGLAVHSDGYLYASTDNLMLRWPYTMNDDDTSSMPPISVDTSGQQLVMNNINDDGRGGTGRRRHITRTMQFSADGNDLFVMTGSYANVDQDSFRSRVRRFANWNLQTSFPVDFVTGEVYADGVRNAVGLDIDKHGTLWAVNNGADQLPRTDLHPDVNEDNPGDEVYAFRQAGLHYGYPYCWAEYSLPDTGLGRNTLWAWPRPGTACTGTEPLLACGDWPDVGKVTDEVCRNNYAGPELALQAHSAPLGITFYSHSDTVPATCTGGSFPEWMDGYAFIAYHGSWNRQVPTGYKVVYVPMDASGFVTGDPVDLLAHASPDAQWEDGFRPVDVSFDSCGRLLVSSDGSGSPNTGSKIVRIEYQTQAGVDTPGPTPPPSPGAGPAPPSPGPPTTSSGGSASLADILPVIAVVGVATIALSALAVFCAP